MADSFRTRVEIAPDTQPSATKTHADTTTKAEAPYTDYEKENAHPFTVDYFQLGDTWNDPNGGFPKEITLIEEFISDRIKKGELPNNKEAVKEAIQKIEKMTNVGKYERPIVKIETLAAYIEFLQKVDKLKFNLGRYANH